MKHVKLIGWASMLFLLVFSSCREDLIDTSVDTKVPEPVVLVNSSLKGQVIDENNEPVEAVTITMGNETITTDEHGFFRFDQTNMNKNGTHVTAEKFGYFFNSKMVNPSLGKESFVLFQMLDKTNIGSFVAADGGSLSTPDGASVSFGSNSIMYENGTAFTGEVQVYAKWLDPTHELLNARMPGDLRAIDTEEELVQLATFGMLVVELEAANGGKLQISEGNSATITLPVPEELQGKAPSSIPLWSFDEETGYWVEESTADFNGNQYVGDVPHFSFWNCDAPFPVVEFETTVVTDAGTPVEFVQVSLEVNSSGLTRYAWTNSDGKVIGKVPKDEVMTISVIDQCSNALYTAEIGPFSSATVLPDIVVGAIIEANLVGTLVKCDGTPVTNGYAFIIGTVYDQLIETDENGYFEQMSFLCAEDDITIKGYDLDVPFTSEPITVTIPAGGGTIDLGDITVCSVITETITVSIPDLSYENEFFIYSAAADPNGGITVNVESSDSIYLYFAFDAELNEVGIVPMTTFSFADQNDPMTQNQFFFCQGATGGGFACPDGVLTINEGTGGILQGSFTGDFATENSGGSDTYEITVTFNVLLD